MYLSLVLCLVIVYLFQLFFFRLPPKRTIPRSLTLSSARKRDTDQLWRHSREPIKQPLLKKLLNKEELCQEACFAFNDILLKFLLFYF